MSLSQRLQHRQSQNLVMTPQLAQSIRLLQLSHGELLEFVKDEVEKNPLLELGNNDVKSTEPESRSQLDGAGDLQSTAQNDGLENTASVMASETMAASQQLDASLDNVFDGGTAGAEKQETRNTDQHANVGNTGASTRSDADDFDMIANMGNVVDLMAHLERQIALAFKHQEERRVATYIAHGLDEDGYFKDSLQEVATENQVVLSFVEHVLQHFQTLEPVGIGARNLAECLAIQLKDQDRYDPAMQCLVENLEMLARRDFKSLMQLCRVDREDFSAMIDEIKALDPRPARSFEPILAETIVPDVIITPTSFGDWNIELNPQTLPKLIVDRDYHLELSKALENTDGEKFVSDCLENANWLTKTLDQRAQTILKVSAEILKRQDHFFIEGKEFLKPMTLKTVADAIKMHESTVSRVTSNKYLTCDHGTFELKFFFTSAISANEGEDQVSSEAVKYKIKQMINAEQSDKILSDEQIVHNLQETGIEIARRTVAKYREAMHISSSVQRRREKSSPL